MEEYNNLRHVIDESFSISHCKLSCKMFDLNSKRLLFRLPFYRHYSESSVTETGDEDYGDSELDDDNVAYPVEIKGTCLL